MAIEAQVLANRRNVEKSASPQHKPPIQPSLTKKYDLFMQNKANFQKVK
jgi:hypothetical protein